MNPFRRSRQTESAPETDAVVAQLKALIGEGETLDEPLVKLEELWGVPEEDREIVGSYVNGMAVRFRHASEGNPELFPPDKAEHLISRMIHDVNVADWESK